MKQNYSTILLVDDDQRVLNVLTMLFSDDYQVITVGSGAEAIAMVKNNPSIATVVLDIKMPEMDGIEAGRQIREYDPIIPVIFHTGYPGDYEESDIDDSEHPFDYITKGRSSTRLIRSVRNAVEACRSRRNQSTTNIESDERFGIIGKSDSALDLFRLIDKVAISQTKVMILGETGTGKELVARAIHNNSDRRDARLGLLNCNHKAPDLIESELFGHKRGAFTGAIEDRIGLFEFANNGTIFLDEIGDLDITTQAKLLRILETGEFQSIGDPKTLKVDVRIICATHHDLEKLVKENKFREDLYYRLKGVVIKIPPLRDRREDIPLMIGKFRDRFTIERGLPAIIFDKTAVDALIEYDWPGNVRQLMDTIESLVVLSESELIVGADIQEHLQTKPLYNSEDLTLGEKMREVERTLIIQALNKANMNISAAGDLLGMERSNLSKKIRSHKINMASMKKNNSA